MEFLERRWERLVYRGDLPIVKVVGSTWYELVQETYLKAWRGYERFEGWSSLRTWLYRIATNVCLTAVERCRRRALPSGLGPPSLDPYAPPIPAPPEVAWPEPVPDRLVIDERNDPAEVVAARHRVRLASVAGMQVLPPRQRAAFIICDVLSVPTIEAAEVLGVSVAALKSLLQRARGRLAEMSLSDEQPAEPTDYGARQVLDRYLAAFESSDLAEMERLLADEAVLEMTGTNSWYSGKATCAARLAGRSRSWERCLRAALDSCPRPIRRNQVPGKRRVPRGLDRPLTPDQVIESGLDLLDEVGIAASARGHWLSVSAPIRPLCIGMWATAAGCWRPSSTEC